MQLLTFLLVYPIIWCISILPFPLLYKLSDGLYVIIYHIVKYRKSVVMHNLNMAFPEKTEAEKLIICKKFYKHLCDMFLEMAKTLSISKKEILKRFIFTNPEELIRLEGLNKSVVVLLAHYASWEWCFAIENYTTYKGIGIYKKIANPYFDNLVKRIRFKFNSILVTTKEAAFTIKELEKKQLKSFIAFISDQSPRLTANVYKGHFLGYEVPCYTGGERLAKELNLTVAYLKINKVKRGFYEAEVITLAEDASKFDNYSITDNYLKIVEAQIRETPEYYFWTHKRFKFAKRSAN